MNKEIRIKRIQEIRDNEEPIGIQEIPWKDGLEPMKVYKIPLELLVYNKYNGRILSRTKSLEVQKQSIDEYSNEGKILLERLLWESKEDRNKKTLDNLYDFGQQKVGIITKDGIIIDGNRRAMLLNKLKNDPKRKPKYDYFKAIVLPITLEENPLEIERLETSFQMGEDEKLGYNATEKYIKAKELYLKLTSKSSVDKNKLNEEAIKKISSWMGESEGEVKKYLSVMLLMDEYLSYLEYDGIYMQLDEREDQFLFLNKWLNNFYGESSKKAFDNYRDDDVDDLKSIAFDYLRFRPEYDGKEFRNLAEGSKTNHFFGDKDTWNSFTAQHRKIIKELPDEPDIDFNSNNIESHLNARNKQYFENSKFGKKTSAFIDNLSNHHTKVEYNKAADAPEKLIARAEQAFDAIKTGHTAFAKPDIQDKVRELGNKIFNTLQKKSPARILDHIIGLLEQIDINKIPKDEIEAIHEKTKKIQKIGYEISKKL